MPNKKLKLLVADDHRLFIEGLKCLLKEELQAEVVDFALNGKEAIEKSHSDDVDVILMDINMPVIDGIQATETIKRIHPYIKVIMLSSISDMPSVTKVLDAGADAFVFKDANTTELVKAFTAIEKGEVYIDSSLAHLFKLVKNGKQSAKELIQCSDNLLTSRERSALKLITEGYTNQQIADILFLSVKTVETHRKHMMAKLKQTNIAGLVRFAIENKLV